MSAPTRPPPPPPQPSRPGVKFGTVQQPTGIRTVLYGAGGIGKTTLAAGGKGPVAFFDLDGSLPILQLDGVLPVDGIANWQDMRSALHQPGWESVGTIVIDSATRAEEMCVDHVVKTVPGDRGAKVNSIEDYGYGRGYGHVFDEFMRLLSDLDNQIRGGRNVTLICHDCVTPAPNPMGQDWIRYEPRLQSPKSGKDSIRLRVREWADHVIFIGYDVSVDKEGKGKGHGSRTAYPTELPHCMAKSRTMRDPLPLDGADVLWDKLNPIKKENF